MNTETIIGKVFSPSFKEKLSYFATAYFYEGKLVHVISSNKGWEKKWRHLCLQDPCVLIGLKTELLSFDWDLLDPNDPLVKQKKEICQAKSGATFFVKHGSHLYVTEVATQVEKDYDLKDERGLFKNVVFPSISLMNSQTRAL